MTPMAWMTGDTMWFSIFENPQWSQLCLAKVNTPVTNGGTAGDNKMLGHSSVHVWYWRFEKFRDQGSEIKYRKFTESFYVYYLSEKPNCSGKFFYLTSYTCISICKIKLLSSVCTKYRTTLYFEFILLLLLFVSLLMMMSFCILHPWILDLLLIWAKYVSTK
jgi:hypothetical protein